MGEQGVAVVGGMEVVEDRIGARRMVAVGGMEACTLDGRGAVEGEVEAEQVVVEGGVSAAGIGE